MEGRQNRDEKTGQERKLGRGTIVCYLSIGTALAISRVALFAWLNHRNVSHTFTETDWYLMWGVYPEALLGIHTPLGLIRFSRTEHLLLWGSLLTLGSFIIATPILLVGWLIRRRRSGRRHSRSSWLCGDGRHLDRRSAVGGAGRGRSERRTGDGARQRPGDTYADAGRPVRGGDRHRAGRRYGGAGGDRLMGVRPFGGAIGQAGAGAAGQSRGRRRRGAIGPALKRSDHLLSGAVRFTCALPTYNGRGRLHSGPRRFMLVVTS